MDIDFLVIFFIVRHLRRSLNTKEIAPTWDKRLQIVMYVSIVLFVGRIVSSDYKTIFTWLAQASFLWLIYILHTQELFKKSRSILIALAPYIIASLFTNLLKVILPGVYDSWAYILGTIIVFTVLWGIGVWIVTARQRKELDKAKAKVLAEEQNNKMISAMKEQLEIQVAERTAELTKQKEELENTLHELKATQAQLIQSEKMASLGELTAGIAHEIQNPLNFVNNFSEVSNELIAEMNAELDKGEIAEAKAIANDIQQNLEKINHHGKRADAIVKGMLQHSRTSSGQNEPTDINALCDEYLRLAYHGLRAKDKSFNADFKTEFDETIEKIDIVPQDIGRVLLNLINNAFYAVTEKRKTATENYKPQVLIETKKLQEKVQISVKDNGSGIPESLKEKIFQPFFTTKPTGSGTGLGLSLSYDIIKAHGGEITVSSQEGEGTAFIIVLPA